MGSILTLEVESKKRTLAKSTKGGNPLPPIVLSSRSLCHW